VRSLGLLAKYRDRLPFARLIGGRYGLGQAGRALEDVAALRVTKAIIDPNDIEYSMLDIGYWILSIGLIDALLNTYRLDRVPHPLLRPREPFFIMTSWTVADAGPAAALTPRRTP